MTLWYSLAPNCQDTLVPEKPLQVYQFIFEFLLYLFYLERVWGVTQLEKSSCLQLNYVLISIIASFYNHHGGCSGRWHDAVLLCSASQTALRMSEAGGGAGRDCRAPSVGRSSVSTVCLQACVTFARGGQECFGSLLRVPENSTMKRSTQKEERPHEPEKGKSEGIVRGCENHSLS